MLTLALLTAVAVTSTLSGIFGMAGGIILMSLLTALLPVASAMMVHGFAQLLANGFRAWMLRRHVRRETLLPYLAGAAVSVAALALVSFVPNPATVMLTLGALPFASLLVPPRLTPDFARPRWAFVAGVLVNGAQIAAGAAGPLLDLFFIRSPSLNKSEIVATKAITQSASHLLKLAYFARAASKLDPASFPAQSLAGAGLLLAGIAISAYAGTWAGGLILARLEEARFRQAGRALLLVLGALFLIRGARLAGL